MTLIRNRLYLACTIAVFCMLLIVNFLTYGSPICLFGNTQQPPANGTATGQPLSTTPVPTLAPDDLTDVPDPRYGNLKYRLVYIRDNIETPAGLAKVQGVMQRAKAAGYNGVVFSNIAMEKLDTASDRYLKNLASAKATADELDLDFYPTVLTVGYANAILSHDPDQIEGLPVKDALFVVSGDRADLAADPPVSLPGGGFDFATNNRFQGWDSQDWVGVSTFVDTGNKHSGLASLRIKATGGVNRVYQNVSVSPFRQYHLTMWIKTQGVTNARAITPYITGADGRELQFIDLFINGTQGWTRYDIVFNSLDNSRIRVTLGTWQNTGGTIWIDDASLEEIGLTNVIRRNECPLVVKGEDGTIYVEGTDYYQVSDPKLGTTPLPGSYDIYHQAPSIRLTPGSRIQDGQRLRVSFCHAITTDIGQVAVSLSSPEAQALFHDQLVSVDNAVSPAGFFLNYDEIRVGNWEERATPMTEGQLLARSIADTDAMVSALRPDARVFVWNDMFDPYHNAVAEYYLCNGTLDGAYEGLPKDMVVVTWNYNSADYGKSLEFWSERGNPLVIAGYYDGKGRPIGQWLKDAESSGARVSGVMYTTWAYNYTALEQFAEDAWGQA